MLLGKCLVFHLKYWPEMKKLYWDEEDIAGLEDSESTKKMVQAVGDKSKQDAEEFLKKCGQVIENHFSAEGSRLWPIQLNKASFDKRWQMSYGIAPGNKPQPQNKKWKMTVGLEIKRETNELLAWIWRMTDKNLQIKMNHLRALRGANTDDPEDDKEKLVLLRDKLLSPMPSDFTVSGQPIMDKIHLAFARIKDQDLQLTYP